ncbi:MAG: ribonuclease H family protein [Clostridium sp.]|uniref:ribonuclease H family protein n=1 Tax=Clostridium sp. TaxID=1506 RepID=UPI0030407AF5
MAVKYYAIKRGIDVQTNKAVNNIIVNTWNECLGYVKGAKGAVYKSFLTRGEAEKYLNSVNSLKKGIDEYPSNIPHIYVDGSYNTATENYGYGVVVIEKDTIIHASYGGGFAEECNQRQVNGELRASIEAVEYAIENKYKEIVIFYDYEGVCQHATGTWERNTTLSKEYYEIINKLKRKGDINIIFVKVDSHTNDLYNDVADELAKVGAGVNIDRVVDKAIKDSELLVKSTEVKKIIAKIIDKNLDRVKCVDESLVESNNNEINREKNIEKIVSYILTLSQEEIYMYLNKVEDYTKNQVIIELINRL